jgi:hypothetical protein
MDFLLPAIARNAPQGGDKQPIRAAARKRAGARTVVETSTGESAPSPGMASSVGEPAGSSSEHNDNPP